MRAVSAHAAVAVRIPWRTASQRVGAASGQGGNSGREALRILGRLEHREGFYGGEVRGLPRFFMPGTPCTPPAGLRIPAYEPLRRGYEARNFGYA
jgi:hypothetical protein